MAETRIQLDMTGKEAIIALSDGNPGAIRVCCELAIHGPVVDPDAGMLASVSALLHLDMLGVYGSRIWMLYKDVCKEDIGKTIAVLRAWQLGILAEAEINHAIEHYGAGIDLDIACSVVEQALPGFDLKARTPPVQKVG